MKIHVNEIFLEIRGEISREQGALFSGEKNGRAVAGEKSWTVGEKSGDKAPRAREAGQTRVCLGRVAPRKKRPRSAWGKMVHYAPRKKRLHYDWGKTRGVRREAPGASTAGKTVECLWRECHEETAVQRPGRKYSAKRQEKKRPLRGRGKTGREAPRTRGIKFNDAGAQKCCAPTQ